MTAQIVSINRSQEKGTPKTPIEKCVVNRRGMRRDAHAGDWHRQISLLSQELIDEFNAAKKASIKPGEFAENITTQGIDFEKIHLLDRFCIGNVLLEITQIGKECHGTSCAIYQKIGECVMPKKGLFSRVLHTGKIKCGDFILHFPREIYVSVITLSDRAFEGEYADRSGPKAMGLIKQFFESNHWRVYVDYKLLPDNKKQLKKAVKNDIKKKTHIIFTLGGTGLGSRDIAPDVIKPMLQKEIPGIMEAIRIKYGETIPSAVLSRSIAGGIEKTQLYCLPGSVKAVEEYLKEIFRTIEHAIYMLNDLKH